MDSRPGEAVEQAPVGEGGTTGIPAVDPAERATLVAERIEAVRARAAAQGASGVLVELRRDAAWLTVGGELHVAQAGDGIVTPILVTARDAIVIAPNNEVDRAREEELAGLPFDIEVVPWHEPAAAAALVARIAGDAVLRGAYVERVTGDLRPRLHPIEHARMRWLAAASARALDGAAAMMAPGRTETEIDAALEAPLLAAGIRAPVVLCAVDDRMRFRHALPRSRRLAARCMLVLVAERWGLHVAGTRMVSPGAAGRDPLPADLAAARVLAAMTAASRPGATLGEVLAVAAEAYEREGLPGEWRTHHQGGTIAYAPRERVATPGDPTVLEAGMAVAWNPSLPGGKVEATLLVRDGNPELLLA